MSKPEQLLLLRGARQLVTLRGPQGIRRGAALEDLAVIENGALLIRDGLIEMVGTTRRLENLKAARDVPEISVDDAVVLPALIDPSLHIVLPAAKSAKTSEFGEQCLSLMRSCMQHGTLQAQLSAAAEQDPVRSAVPLLRQLTRIGDHPIGMQRSWRPPASQPDAPAYSSEEIRTTLAYLQTKKMLHAVDLTVDQHGGASNPLLLAIQASGVDVNLFWASGFASILPDLLRHLRLRSVLCPPGLSAQERAVLSQSPLPLVFSPTSLSAEETPDDTVRHMADAGAPLALSSGYHSKNAPVFNMQMTLALAVWRLGLSIEQAISAATINAAQALHLDRVLGSLEVGKRADLIVLNLSDYRELPRRWGTNHVGMAMRDGKILFNRTGWKVSAA